MNGLDRGTGVDRATTAGRFSGHLPQPDDQCVAVAQQRDAVALCEIGKMMFQAGTGSASRVTRAIVMSTPPSIDLGEVTDKGSINQRAVLTHRAELVEALYAGQHPSIYLPRY